jgi:hypothetical protein
VVHPDHEIEKNHQVLRRLSGSSGPRDREEPSGSLKYGGTFFLKHFRAALLSICDGLRRPEGRLAERCGVLLLLVVLMNHSDPAADQLPEKYPEKRGNYTKTGNLPRRASKNLMVLLASHSRGIRRLGEALRRGTIVTL